MISLKRKSLVTLCISVILLSSLVVLGQENTEILEFDLDSAIEYALENNIDIKISDINIENSILNIRDIKEQTKDIQKLPAVYKRQGFDIYKTWFGHSTKEMKYLSELNKKNKELMVKTIKYKVKEAFYNLHYIEQSIIQSQHNIDELNNQLKIIEKKIELGIATELEKTNVQVQIEQAFATLEQYKNEFEIAKLSFAKLIGLPLDTDFKLNYVDFDELDFEYKDKIDIEEAITQALNKRIEIFIAKNEYELAKNEAELGEKFYVSKKANQIRKEKRLYNAKELKYLELIKSEQNVKLSVRQAYNNLKSVYNQIKILEKSLESSKTIYDLTKLRYELGMATYNDLLIAQNNYNDILIKHTKVINDYRLSVEKFKMLIDIGIQPSI